MTITEFLLARVAEDEAVAQGVANPLYADEPFSERFDCYESTHTRGDSEHIQRWQPSRVLAECEAKRRIVEVYQQGEVWPVLTLRAIAQPYRDHPDFDPEWAL